MINNSVNLIGRLTKDPTLNKTESGLSVANVTVASDRYQSDADFIPIQVWRQSADYLCQYGHKGDMVAIQGSIKVHKYQDKTTGKDVYKTYVIADGVKLLSSKNDKPIEKQKEMNKQDHVYPNSLKHDEFDTGPLLDISSDDLPF